MDIQKRMELRSKVLAAKDLEKLARLYQKTKNRIFLWIALKKGHDVDYIPGQDDGEVMERHVQREVGIENGWELNNEQF